MINTIISISVLLVSFAILVLGHALAGTVVSIRAALENFPDWTIGFMMSGFFFGYISGTFICVKYIDRVGQIRTFAAFASLLSIISLLYVLLINPAAWIILRILNGLCIAGLYMIIESWLNALANRGNRGRILSTYMSINFLCLAAGQGFFFFADIKGAELFIISSILVSLSVIPLILSKTKQPHPVEYKRFNIVRLFRISPLSVTGALLTGMVSGAYWGLIAVYLTRVGLMPNQIALFICLSFLGGFLLQWPIGTLSDKVNRRFAIAVCSFLSVIASITFIYMTSHYNPQTITITILFLAPLFGGFSYPLYSLFISLANDFLEPEHFVKASAGLLATHGIGAIIGPLAAAVLMEMTSYNGLFIFIGIAYGFTFMFAVIRMVKGRRIPENTKGPFVPVPRTAAAILSLDPRYNRDGKE